MCSAKKSKPCRLVHHDLYSLREKKSRKRDVEEEEEEKEREKRKWEREGERERGGGIEKTKGRPAKFRRSNGF